MSLKSPMFVQFFQNFFTTDNNYSMLHRNVCKGPLRKLEISRNFIKIFQKPYQLISNCLHNFLKMFEKLPKGRTERNIQGGVGRLQNHWKCQLKVWVITFFLFFSYLRPWQTASQHFAQSIRGLIQHWPR